MNVFHNVSPFLSKKRTKNATAARPLLLVISSRILLGNIVISVQTYPAETWSLQEVLAKNNRTVKTRIVKYGSSEFHSNVNVTFR